MTQPVLSKQISGLLRLSGQDKVDISLNPAGQEILIVKLISDCLGNGSTWADIGTVLIGTPDGKRAKCISKRLAKDAQRQMLRKANGQSG